MYSLTNTGPSVRIVYDIRHRAIEVLPGQKRENVQLDDGAADRLARRAGALKVERMEILPVVPVATPASVATEAPEVPAVRTVAQLLVSAADDMPYVTLRREAARTLGDAWPGGKPSKGEIIQLLQNAKLGF